MAERRKDVQKILNEDRLESETVPRRIAHLSSAISNRHVYFSTEYESRNPLRRLSHVVIATIRYSSVPQPFGWDAEQQHDDRSRLLYLENQRH